MRFDVEFDTARLERALIQRASLTERNIDVALLKSAIILHSQMNLEVPVDTGNLAASLNFRKGREKHTYEVYTNVEYAWDVEYGTMFKAPNDFMRRSYRMKQSEMKKLIKQAINQSLGGR